jgi:hypothetical protein
MAIKQLTDLRELVEQMTTIPDPAERDRALAVIEDQLKVIQNAIGTYRGDAQVQLGGRGDGDQPPE